ncbi:hypothetical protein U27_05720 [Candidatus Vecturithrix granuli]|uniref:Uncharacterized protein n=1 Tax=Vecturithrix granuli TaxID=1499967 RepID=A0A081C2E0_VECG1|nr:hypothetical protein U27_05720 [Candidatus Vecturithrix granuli]
MGFLPFETTAGDRVFVSAMTTIAIHLLWLRFVEQLLPIWVATLLCVMLGILIFKKG